MDLLYMLEGVRTPFFDAVLGALTYLGDKVFVTVAIMIVLWCFDKRGGYFLFYITVFSTGVNQFLKQLFCVPRPWVLDPEFTIVENARAAATGWSFPSGHSTGAVGLFGGLLFVFKKWWVRLVCVVLALLVAFSRLYLGVHTPLDVGVGALIGVVAVVALWFALERCEASALAEFMLNFIMIAFAAGFVLFAELIPSPEGTDPELAMHAVKNGYMLLGLAVGLTVTHAAERKWVRYEIHAVWWVQLLKTFVGLAVVGGVLAGVKEPLLALTGGHSSAEAIRYLLVTLAGGLFYPMTFKLWYKLDKHRVSDNAR